MKVAKEASDADVLEQLKASGVAAIELLNKLLDFGDGARRRYIDVPM